MQIIFFLCFQELFKTLLYRNVFLPVFIMALQEKVVLKELFSNDDNGDETEMMEEKKERENENEI